LKEIFDRRQSITEEDGLKISGIENFKDLSVKSKNLFLL